MSGDTVIVAVDGSEYSDYALEFYAETIHKPENKVILVHSTEFKFVYYPAANAVAGDIRSITREIEEEEEKSKALEQKLKLELDKYKIDGTVVRLHGEAGHAFVQLANEEVADLIVVGCRGKGSIRRTFTGSVTDFIVHHAEVPVIVARHRDHINHRHHFHLNPFHTNPGSPKGSPNGSPRNSPSLHRKI